MWIDLRLGTIYTIPADNIVSENEVTFLNIPFYDSPILIADLIAIAKWT